MSYLADIAGAGLGSGDGSHRVVVDRYINQE